MNKTLLKQLYDGEIYPAEAVGCENIEYRDINRKISDEKELLEATLSPEDWNRLEKLDELRFESSSMYAYDNFIYGFKLGVSLMAESLMTGNPVN